MLGHASDVPGGGKALFPCCARVLSAFRVWCQNTAVGLRPAAKSGGPREGSGRQETLPREHAQMCSGRRGWWARLQRGKLSMEEGDS